MVETFGGSLGGEVGPVDLGGHFSKISILELHLKINLATKCIICVFMAGESIAMKINIVKCQGQSMVFFILLENTTLNHNKPLKYTHS